MKIRFIKVILIVLVSSVSVTIAQGPPLWHGLTSGPYAVGFRVVWKDDNSRTWRPDVDFKGKPLPVEAARPVRISVWYPAQLSSKSVQMPYSGYLYAGSPDQRFSEMSKGIEDYDLKSVRNYFESPGLFNKLLKTPTASHLDARPANGKFPLVVFSLGQNDHTLENIVLWEFLASHGYVVVTVPQVGTSPRRFQLLVHDPLMYEAQVRDLEFAIQQMHELPYVNAEKLALMGHSFGGIYSLLVAMRHTEVDAVVGLDPTYMSKQPSFHYKYWEAPYYDVANIKAPMLVLYKGIEPENVRTDIVADLKYSDRSIFKFPHLVHGDFNSAPMIASLSTGEDYADREYSLKFRTLKDGITGHEIICRYVLNFLNAHLKDDAQALRYISESPDEQGVAAGTVERDFKPGLKSPTEEEFYTIIQKKGIDAAISIYREAKAKYPNDVIIREPTIKRIGSEAGYYGKPAEAVDIYKLYVEAYPQSADAYDRLGGAYDEIGNKELAIKNYERSLELDPQNADANEQLKRLKQK